MICPQGFIDQLEKEELITLFSNLIHLPMKGIGQNSVYGWYQFKECAEVQFIVDKYREKEQKEFYNDDDIPF